MSVENRPIVGPTAELEILDGDDPAGFVVVKAATSEQVPIDHTRVVRFGLDVSAASEDALIRGGVFSSTWRNFEAFGFLNSEIAKIIDTSLKSILRKKKIDALLSVSEADRTVRFSKVLAEALDAFDGDATKVLAWLRSPVRHLGGKTPMEMLETEAGTTLVRESISAIAYGGIG